MEFMAKMGSFRVMSVLLSKNKLRSVKLESYIGAGTVAFDHVRSPSLPFLVVSAQIDVLRMYTRLPITSASRYRLTQSLGHTV